MVISEEDLRRLEMWAGQIMRRLESAERKKLTRKIGTELRKTHQRRIVQNKNVDGSNYVPRKDQKEITTKSGRIKRTAKMFMSLSKNKFLKVRGDQNQATLYYTGKASKIARVHQHGLAQSPRPGVRQIWYAKRELLGFNDVDIKMVQDLIIDQIS